MSDSFYYEDSKCPKCPRKDRARLADQTLGVSHVKDVTRFWKRGTRSWGPPPSGSLSLGLFQSFLKLGTVMPTIRSPLKRTTISLSSTLLSEAGTGGPKLM